MDMQVEAHKEEEAIIDSLTWSWLERQSLRLRPALVIESLHVSKTPSKPDAH